MTTRRRYEALNLDRPVTLRFPGEIVVDLFGQQRPGDPVDVPANAARRDFLGRDQLAVSDAGRVEVEYTRYYIRWRPGVTGAVKVIDLADSIVREVDGIADWPEGSRRQYLELLTRRTG